MNKKYEKYEKILSGSLCQVSVVLFEKNYTELHRGIMECHREIKLKDE